MRKNGHVGLVGYAGSGKSSCGKRLATYQNKNFIDMDVRIERDEGTTINAIFDDPRRGENYFRECERGVLRDVVLSPVPVIISTGGGTFVNEDNRRMMLSETITVWLDAPFEMILERLKDDTTRPLMRDRVMAEQRYIERVPFYRQAHIRVDARGSTEEVVQSILRELSLAET